MYRHFEATLAEHRAVSGRFGALGQIRQIIKKINKSLFRFKLYKCIYFGTVQSDALSSRWQPRHPPIAITGPA